MNTPSAAASIGTKPPMLSHLAALAARRAARSVAGAARRFLAFVDDVREFIVGDSSYSVGWFCRDCIDVHAEGAYCPRAMVGECVDCEKVVELDRFGNCVLGHRGIERRRMARSGA